MQQYIKIENIVADLKRIGYEFELLEEIDSTNEYLKRQIKSSEMPNGKVAVAIKQIKGKGSKGRSWVSNDTACLKLSISKKTSIPKDRIPLLSPSYALGICRELNENLMLGISIKWPNDLFGKNGKLGGILLETAHAQDGFYVIAGLGLNLFPFEESREVLGRTVDFLYDDSPLNLQKVRSDLVVMATKAFATRTKLLEEEPLISDYEDWRSFDLLYDKQIEVELAKSMTVSGVEKGIDSLGRLLLMQENGGMRKINFGEVVLKYERNPD